MKSKVRKQRTANIDLEIWRLKCFYETFVLLPSYVKAGSTSQKEDQVKQIFKQVFPNRKLIFIDAMPLNWEGGGIHCGTQQQPKL